MQYASHVVIAAAVKQPRLRSRVQSELASTLCAFSAPSKRLCLVVLPLLIPNAVLSQSTPYFFTPRHSSGSAVANGELYVVSGTSSELQVFTDVIALSLTNAFSTNALSWTPLNPGVAGEDAQVVASPDGNYLLLVGSSDGQNAILKIYDIKANTWQSMKTTTPGFPYTAPYTSPGIALDQSTDTFLIYGGYSASARTTSSDMVLLTINGSNYNDWIWSSPTTYQQAPPLYQPITVYIPALQSTLIMGGCTIYTPNVGPNNCTGFNTGYLVKTKATVNGTISTPPYQVYMTGSTIPIARVSPCYVLLDNGEIFMYGGATFSKGLSDAWVLNPDGWTWRSIDINNSTVVQGRAGATCQRIAKDRVIVIGGYNGSISGPQSFTEPQIALLNTQNWAWVSNYEPDASSSRLPVLAVVGISFGASLLLGLVVFVVGGFFWKRHSTNRQKRRDQSRRSHSSYPLIDSTNDGEHNSSSNHLIPPRDLFFSGLDTRSFSRNSDDWRSAQRSILPKDGKTLPLIIVPYSPTETMSSASFPVAATAEADSSTKKTRRNDKVEIDFAESKRLSRTVADIQHGYYIRTLQHNKYYDMRRSDLQRTQPGLLSRADTTVHHKVWNEDDPEDQPYLATSLLNLREVELGEEPTMIPLQALETGLFLVSSHMNTSDIPSVPSSSVDHGATWPSRQQNIAHLGTKADNDSNDDDREEYQYVPTVGGPITALRAAKAAKAKIQAEATMSSKQGSDTFMDGQGGSMMGQGEIIPGKAELDSDETRGSELLIDN
ncbi:hypothetical protein BGZ54_005119 [Gamsiella multidivaricata]|nr:hypothetical protein BGZ54_005119 [Gamsiella multidivaricata]